MKRILSLLPALVLAFGMTAWGHGHGHGNPDSKCTGKSDCPHECCKRKNAKKTTSSDQPAASDQNSSKPNTDKK